MWYDDKIKSYGDNFYEINKLYTEKYGYTLIKSSERTYTDRKPHWERFPLMLKYIESYDYIIWIDADAHFYRDAPPIENLIKKYNKDIILSADRDTFNPKPRINSGVIIMKNTQKNIEILNKWAYSKELKKSSDILYNGKWQDQGVIRLYVKNNIDNINNISAVSPYLELQHFYTNELSTNRYNPFIHHYAGTSTSIRSRASAKYLSESQADSTGLIIGIVVGFILLFILFYYRIYRK